MKSSLFGLIVGGLWAVNFLLQAQTNVSTTSAPSPQVAREMKMISFLTPAQQQQYAQVRAKALEDNPALKAEGETLMQQGEAVMGSGSAADKLGFMDQMNLHRQKLRTAMLKEDPTVAPIFAQIDTHIAELRARQPVGAQK